MSSYLAGQFTLSVLLFIPALFLARYRHIPNKLRLALLYLMLFKLLFPWGTLTYSTPFFPESVPEGGISFDRMAAVTAGAGGSFSSGLTHEQTLLILWAVVFLSMAAFSLLGHLSLARKIKRASESEDAVIEKLMTVMRSGKDGLHSVKVLISGAPIPPFVWWRKQWLIVLPRTALALTSMEKKVVLAHELVHIQRRDFIKFIALKMIKMLFFFSPLVFFLIREILDREETATDLKAMHAFGIPPTHFGRTIISTLGLSAPMHCSVPTMVNPAQRRLKMRLEGLFPNRQTMRAKWIQAGFLISLLILLPVNFTFASSTPQHASSKEFTAPLASGKMTLGFGTAKHPFSKKEFKHLGVDLAATMNTPVLASADGEVIKVDFNDRQGHFLILAHENGYTTYYAHLAKIAVAEGSVVEQGSEIAMLGNSGLSTGPHVHFEIRKDNEPLDPLQYIQVQ